MKHARFFILLLLLCSCRTPGYIADTGAQNTDASVSVALLVLENSQPLTDEGKTEDELGMLFKENQYEAHTRFFSQKFYDERIYEKLLKKDTSFYYDQKMHTLVDRVALVHIFYTCGNEVKYAVNTPFKCQCVVEVRMLSLNPCRTIERKVYNDAGGGNTEAEARQHALEFCLMKMRKMFPFDFNPTSIHHVVPEK